MVGCFSSIVFCVLGIETIIDGNTRLASISAGLFLVFFGLAGAVVTWVELGNNVDGAIGSAAAPFGFLRSSTGRGMYYLVLGFYTASMKCFGYWGCYNTSRYYGDDGRWHTNNRGCFDCATTWGQVCVIASICAVVLGIVMLIMVCVGKLPSDSCGGITGQTRSNMEPLEWAAVVASVGIIVAAFSGPNWGHSNGNFWWNGYTFSYMFILLTFGVGSLLSTLCNSAFVSQYFRFMAVDGGWHRGMFFLLVGFWVYGAYGYDRGRDSLGNTIATVGSICAVIVGVVILVKACT